MTLNTLVLLWALSIAGAPSDGPLVLMYHQVADVPPGEGEQFVMPLVRLEEQLVELKARGYQSVHAERWVQASEDGLTGEGLRVILTFDDAHDSDWKLVAPLLEKHGFRGLFFPTGRRLEGERADRYRELVRRGHEVGSHTMNHYYLTKKGTGRSTCGRMTGCTPEDIRRELTTSMERLKKIVGPTTLLAWPGNYYDTRTMQMAREVGYRGLFAVEKQRKGPDGVLVGLPGRTRSTDEIFRVEIGGRCSLAEFRRAIRERRGCVHSKRKFHRHYIPQEAASP